MDARQDTGRALDKRVARNTGYLMASFAVGTAAGVVTAIVLARGLGEVGLGQFGFTMAVAGVLGLLADLGVNELTVREVARDHGCSQNLLRRSLRTKAWLCLVYGLGVVVVWAVMRPTHNPGTADGFLLVAPIGFFTFAASAYAALLRGLEAMAEVMWLNIGTAFTQLAAVSMVIWLGGGVFPLLAVTLGVQALRTLAGALIVRRMMPESSGEMDAGLFSLVRLSLPFAVTTILYVLYCQMDMLLMGVLSDDAQTGYFHVASRAREIPRGLSGAFIGAFYPALSAALKGSKGNTAGDLRKATLFLVGYGLLVAIAITLVAEPIIGWVLGERFLPAAPAVRLTGWAVLFRVLVDLFLVYLFAAGLERLGPKIFLGAVIVAAIGGWFVIPGTGAVGGAAVMLTTDALLCMVLAFVVFRRKDDPLDSKVENAPP